MTHYAESVSTSPVSTPGPVALRVLSRVPEAFAALTLLALFAVVCVQLVVRVLGVSAPWTLEIAQSLFIWLACLGIALSVKWHGHFTVASMSEHLPDPLRRVARIGRELVVLGVGVVLLVSGAKLTSETTGFTMPSTGLSMALVDVALPVAAVLMCAYAANNLWHAATDELEERS